MNRSLKQFFRLLWKSLLFWSIAMGLLEIFRYYGIGQTKGIDLSHDFNKIGLHGILIAHVGLGFSIGFLYTIIDFVFEKLVSKKLTLGLRMFIKNIVYLISTIALFTLVIEIYSSISQLNISNEFGWWRENKVLKVIVFMFTCFFLFENCDREVW